MRVADLRMLLDMLPGDMVVHVAGGGPGCFHVGEVRKNSRRTIQGPYGQPDLRAEPSLVIEPGHPRVYWFDPEPPVEIRGRWPRPRMTADDERELLSILGHSESASRGARRATTSGPIGPKGAAHGS